MGQSNTIRKLCLLAVCSVCISNYAPAQKILDSIYTYYFLSGQDSVFCFKQKYAYDAAGHNTSVARYYYDSKLGWCGACFYPGNDIYGYGRFDYNYDESGHLTETTGYSGGNINWGKQTREKNEYDGDGNLVTWYWQGWSGAKNDWVADMGKEFGYNEAGQNTSIRHFNWDPVQNSWQPAMKGEISYDTSGEKVLDLFYLWNTTLRDWTLDSKTEWTYDSFGNQIVCADSAWTWVKKKYVWVEKTRREGITDSNGHIISEYWNMGQGLNSKFVYAYDSGGRMISKIWSSRWNNQEWRERERSEWAYDPPGKLILETWVGDIMDFDVVEPIKIERTFDSAGDKICETFYNSNGNRQIFTLRNKDYYFYRTSVTGTQDIPVNHIKVYPNPTSGNLNISGLTGPAEVKIYSLLGMLLRTLNQVENTVDISDLPAGIYIMRVANKNQTLANTFIIKE